MSVNALGSLSQRAAGAVLSLCQGDSSNYDFLIPSWRLLSCQSLLPVFHKELLSVESCSEHLQRKFICLLQNISGFTLVVQGSSPEREINAERPRSSLGVGSAIVEGKKNP